MKGYSECCDAPIVNGLCNDCKEHTDPQKYDCEICQDTGEVSCDEMDKDGNWERGVGTRLCECAERDLDDFSGATEGDR